MFRVSKTSAHNQSKVSAEFRVILDHPDLLDNPVNLESKATLQIRAQPVHPVIRAFPVIWVT